MRKKFRGKKNLPNVLKMDANQYAELTTKTRKALRLTNLNSCRENIRLVPHGINCYNIYDTCRKFKASDTKFRTFCSQATCHTEFSTSRFNSIRHVVEKTFSKGVTCLIEWRETCPHKMSVSVSAPLNTQGHNIP